MPTLAVIWRASGLTLATDAESVVEVLPPVACRPMPGAPPWVRGMFIHRGELIPLVIAERLLAGLASPPEQPPADPPAGADRMINRVLVIRLAPSGDSPARRIGLWVESILELERIEFAGAGSHPGFDSEAARFLGPIAHTRFGLVQLVNADELFNPEQARLLTRQLSEASV